MNVHDPPTVFSPLSPGWQIALLVPVVYLGVCGLVAAMGWRAFTRRYPVNQRPPGRSYTCPDASFDRHSLKQYSGVVIVVFCEAGIYFRMSWLFAAFLPPFLLPWSSVESIRRVPYESFWLRSGYQLSVTDTAGDIRLWAPLKAGADLERFCPGGTEARRPGEKTRGRRDERVVSSRKEA